MRFQYVVHEGEHERDGNDGNKRFMRIASHRDSECRAGCRGVLGVQEYHEEDGHADSQAIAKKSRVHRRMWNSGAEGTNCEAYEMSANDIDGACGKVKRPPKHDKCAGAQGGDHHCVLQVEKQQNQGGCETCARTLQQVRFPANPEPPEAGAESVGAHAAAFEELSCGGLRAESATCNDAC